MMNFLGFYLNLKVYAKNTSAKEMPFRSYFNGLMFPELWLNLQIFISKKNPQLLITVIVQYMQFCTE